MTTDSRERDLEHNKVDEKSTAGAGEDESTAQEGKDGYLHEDQKSTSLET